MTWTAISRGYGDYTIEGTFATKREAINCLADIHQVNAISRKSGSVYEVDADHLVMRTAQVARNGYIV